MNRIIRIITIVMAAGCCGHTYAQTTQQGVVQEYNERAKKTPLSGVTLKVKSAGSTVSDDKGNFTLQFRVANPGERVNVSRIEKLGYEVFNRESLEQWNINPAEPFVVVMCRSDRFRTIRDNYERVSSESYARQMERDKAELERLRTEGKLREAEYQQQLADLEENYEKQLDNLENYVDRFARIDLSELSAIEQEIIELVQQGRIDEAIARYEEQNFAEGYVRAAAQRRAAEAILEHTRAEEEANLAGAERHIATLKLAGGSENFEKILAIYATLTSDNGVPFSIVKSYISTLLEQMLLKEVIDYGNTYLERNPNLMPVDKECVLNSIGNAYNQLGDYNAAIEMYKNALNEVEAYASQQPEYAQHRRLIIRNNISITYRRIGEIECASIWLTASDDEIPYDDFELSSSELRRLHESLIVERRLQHFDKADSIADAFMLRANQMNPVTESQRTALQELMAVNQQALGSLHYSQQHYDKAKAHYKKSIGTYEDLYKYNPRRYAGGFANTLFNMALMYRMEGDSIAEGIPYLRRALDITEPIIMNGFSQPLLENFCQAMDNIGLLYDSVSDSTACLALADRAKFLLQSLDQSPYDLYPLYISLAHVYEDMGQHEEALKYDEMALPAIKKKYEVYPQRYVRELVTLYANMGMTASRCHNDEYCAKSFSECIPLLALMDANSHEDRVAIIDVLNRGFLFLFQTDYYEDALKYLRRLQELMPENIKLFEFECAVLAGKGRMDDAKEAFAKLLSVYPDYPTDSQLYQTLKVPE